METRPGGSDAAAVVDEQAVIVDALVRLGLVEPGTIPHLVPLTGGVSSDIFRVDLPGGRVCVKRARPRLRVEARWEVPVARNAYEYRWLEVVGAIVPDLVPGLLGRDEQAGLFAMAYLDPAGHPVWKDQLLRGEADPATAARVGAYVGAVHAATADSHACAAAFATDDLFRDLRLHPYLEVTAAAHPEVRSVLEDLAATTAGTRRALVHGDVSPKNILVGPKGPVLLDAECAWFGDPAFDLAFCLNHLVLKGFHRPADRAAYAACAEALAASYLAEVTWEPPASVEARAARLLPALLLARVDGTSPVEYLDDDRRSAVRRAAVDLLAAGADSLGALLAAIEREGGDG